MLLSLTAKCNEMCTHCCVSATPDGAHMTLETLENAMRFVSYYDPICLTVTGGDPFLVDDLNKYILVIMKALQNRKTQIIFESNGWWIEDKAMCKKLVDLLNMPRVLGLQISTHKKFYPNYDWTMKHKDDFTKLHPKIQFDHDKWAEGTKEGLHLHYLGRAQDIMKDEEIINAPSCSNLLSWSKNYDRIPYDKVKGLKRIIDCLEYRGKFCSPFIWNDGRILVGESPMCTSIGNVNDIEGVGGMRYFDWIILDKLKNTVKFCDKCKEARNVDPAKRMLLGL